MFCLLSSAGAFARSFGVSALHLLELLLDEMFSLSLNEIHKLICALVTQQAHEGVLEREKRGEKRVQSFASVLRGDWCKEGVVVV